MGIDLTSGFLVSFILAELKPVVARHPRFRANAGATLAGFSNLITYNDLSLTVTNIRSNGDAQSPDNFITTLMGRAVHAKLDGKPGSFIEWVRETPQAPPVPGLYYFAVDQLNETTRDVRLILQRYRWLEGSLQNAVGTVIHLRPGLSAQSVTPQDPSVEVTYQGTTLTLLTYVEELVLLQGSVELVPGVDWWIEAEERIVILQDAPGGQVNGLTVPPDWMYLALEDQEGDQLRQGTDWHLLSDGTIQLAPWTAAGSTITAVGRWRKTPGPGVPLVHPENYLDPQIPTGQTLVAGQCFYQLPRGRFDSDDLLWLPDGRAVLKNLLTPGDGLRWELRVLVPQVYVSAKKMAINPQIIPGLEIAIGDQVELGDKSALVVFPNRCETYEVYGAKDGVGFEIVIKSNDLLTTSELAGMVRDHLLVDARSWLESNGLTIYKVSTSYQGAGKDASGTSAVHTATLSVQAAGDWEQHRPLINRVDEIDLSGVDVSLPGSPTVVPRLVAYGASRFSPAYS